MVYDPGPVALLRSRCIDHPVTERWHPADCVVCAEKRHLPGKYDQKDHGRKGGQAALDAAPYNLSKVGGTDVLPDPQVEKALSVYRSHGYRQINAHMRGEKVFTGPLAAQYAEQADGWISQIDRAMAVSPLTSAVVVHRGVPSVDATFGRSMAGHSDLTGMTWRDKAFVSTSADKSVADGFAGEVVMKIAVPRGTHAITVSGASDESEMLLDRGLTFKVTGQTDVTLDNGLVQRQLDVAVVG